MLVSLLPYQTYHDPAPTAGRTRRELSTRLRRTGTAEILLLLLLFTMYHCSNWTWVVEEILAFWYKAAFYALLGIQLFETMQTRLLR